MDCSALILNALKEDVGSGDHSSLACVPENAIGNAKLLVKEPGILAGLEAALQVLQTVDSSCQVTTHFKDGDTVKPGDVVFELTGKSRSILTAERLLLNIMQRMSGIATITNRIQQMISPYSCTVLDTRKTTPGFRQLEKWAVAIGGGTNHRMGLYDMIMIKDNHIDYAGGIAQAIKAANSYIQEKSLSIEIEIETRDLDELKQVLKEGNVQRIMLDNYSLEDLSTAVKWIDGKYKTEASGGITEETVVEIAKTGVDYISMGALTHSVKSLDLSLKAVYA